MKPRERLCQMRKTNCPVTRVKLARDHIPGTKFDDDIQWACVALRDTDAARRAGKGKPQSHFSPLESFGEIMARAIADYDAPFFRDLADALDVWRKYQPQPDKLREAIIIFYEKLPPTKASIARMNREEKLRVPYTKWKPTAKVIPSMRSIIQHLRAKKIIPATMKESAGLADIRRNVRRICKELGLALHGESGRPQIGTRTQAKG